MRKITIPLLLVSLTVFFCADERAHGQSRFDPQAVYDRWNQVLDSDSILTEPLFFSKSVSRDLTDAVEAMDTHRLELTTWILDRFSKSDTAVSYRGAVLLNHLAGVYYFLDQRHEDLGQSSKLDRFKSEWKNGEFKRPDEKLKSLLDDMKSQELAELTGDSMPPARQERLAFLTRKLAAKQPLETSEQKEYGELRMRQRGVKLAPENIAKLREYGVYGLPALLTAAKNDNRAYAFAALLMIIDGKAELYAEYLKRPDSLYDSVEKKTAFVQTWWAENKSQFDATPQLRTRIETALE